jgi:CheY-like chemotaxis protein
MPRNKVLLVDNEVENLRLYEISFRRAGFIPTIATDGADALKKIELFQPDLIIAEVNLPNMDGYEFCAEVKNDPRFRSIPFLFLTKEKSIENKVMGLELGADDYLVKPIFLKELITRAKMLVDRRDKDGMRGSGEQKSLSGVLGEMEIVDLIQIMEMGVKSGIVNLVFEGGEEGKIYFRRGKIIKIQFMGFEGIKAFFRILNRSRGSFNVDFVEPEVEDNLEMTTHEIVMEGMRCIDEWRGISEGMPPLDSVLAVNSDMILGTDPDEEVLSGASNILGEFDGKRTIWEVIDRVSESDLENLKKISHLYFEGYLIPVAKIEKEEKPVEPVPEEITAPAEPIPVEAGEEPTEDYDIEHIFLDEVPVQTIPDAAGKEAAAPIISGPAPASTPTKKRTLAEIEKASPLSPKAGPVSEKPEKHTELEIEVDFFSEGEEATQRLASEKPPAAPVAAAPAPPPVETKLEFEVPVPAVPPVQEQPPAEIKPEVKEEVKEAVKPRRKPISDEEMWFLPPEEAAQASMIIKPAAAPKVISAKLTPAAKAAAPPPKAAKAAAPPPKAAEVKPEKTPTPETAPLEPPAPPKAKKGAAPVRRVQLSPTLIVGGVAAVIVLVAVSVLVISMVKKNRVPRAPAPVQVAQVPEEPASNPSPEKKSEGGEMVPVPSPAVTKPPAPVPEKPPKEIPAANPPAPTGEKPAAPVENEAVKPREKPAAPAPVVIAAKPKTETKPVPVKPTTAAPAQVSAVPAVIAPAASVPAVKIDPDMSKIHLIKGKALYLKGDKKGAATEFSLAVSLNPRSPDAQFNLGVALHENGRVAEAVKALQTAIELNPRNPEAFRILGILYQKLGDQKNSSDCFQKYLSLLSE